MRHDLIQDPASFQKIWTSSLGVNVARVDTSSYSKQKIYFLNDFLHTTV